MHDDDHPLLVELVSLRQTAARFQHEAHAAAIKLQRHTFDVSRIHQHAAALEQENASLMHEIGVLRAHPDIPPHPAVAQVQELSLALRRISDKIDLTEQTLLERTSELAQVHNELARVHQTADGAHELAARMRAREEAAKARERELELKARASDEERKMVDLVVQEYADLVRNLEGRKSAHHTPSIHNGTAPATTTLVDTLVDTKSNLHRVLMEFSTESESLHATIAELNAKISMLQMTLDAERVAASHDRTLFSQTKIELDKLNLEDQTAAKMVTRYMKFSQASTNALQQQITALRARHTSTIATLELQLSIAETRLESERARTARLQDALDELCQDLARESYGRRREVALRLALLSREEGIAELMRRWVRRARELYARCYNATPPVSSEDAIQEAFHRVVTDAESILSTLDDGIQFSDGTHASGAQARIVLSRAAVDTLRGELQDEMQKRIEAVRQSALFLPNKHLNGAAPGIEDSTQPDNTSFPSGNEAPEQLLLMPSGSAPLEHAEPPVELPRPEDADSPALMVGAPEGIVDDPFVIPAFATPSTTGITEHVIVHEEINSLPSVPIQETSSASIALLVDEGSNTISPHTPTASILDLREEIHPYSVEEHPTTDVAPIHGLPSDTPISTPAVQAEDDTVVPSTSMSTSTIAEPHAVLDKPSLVDTPPTLLSELGATKHRYDAFQRAFRDCSFALKELKGVLASSSPSPHTQTKLRQHFEVALARIDDYAEDARVELEIRVADEELTVRGFEMVLSVPAALVDADERAEVEASAWMFVDGTDEGVTTALDKFGKKLEDVQHDVAVVKRAVHELALSEGEAGDEGGRGSRESEAGSGWSAWTTGLLGATATPSRSPTPVQTFGTVMTSPRLRHATSSKQLHEQGSTEESSAENGPLAGLNLRIPMPMASPSPSYARWGYLGLGRAADGETPPRTLSAMYSVGGLRSSSIRLGVGLSGSPSPAPSRGMAGLGMRMRMGSVSSQGHEMEDTRGTNEVQLDLGVE